MDPFELTKELMRIPSVTGNEGGVGKYLARWLRESGYRVEMQPVTEERFNVLAFRGEPKIVFCTHMDTVAPQLPVSEDGLTLYGRGACDTKGIIAAMLKAGELLSEEGLCNFAFLFVVGEESGGDGAKAANNLEWNCEYVVVGEPTENKLARAQKGTLCVELTVTGKAGHSGYPETGSSAVVPLVDVLGDCMRLDWGLDAVLGKGTFNVGVLEAGVQANVIPAEAKASVMIRLVEDVCKGRERLIEVVAGRAEIEIKSSSSPQFMNVLDGFAQTVVSFGSDVPYLSELGKPFLVGPGSITDAHTASEKIVKSDLLDGIELYSKLARRLIAE